MSEQFNAKEYWEKRLQGNYDLHGVGLIEWGAQFNQWLYRIRRHGFLKSMLKEKASWDGTKVLDVGSGTGFYLACWKELGAEHIHGMDLTEVAAQNLQEKFPDMNIHCGDIGANGLTGMDQTFDAISCMDVLFHIVDDEMYGHAFKHITQMLKDDGLFVFSDSWLKGEDVRGVHIVHRSRRLVSQLLEQAGLEVVEVRPMFVLMNAPVDSHNALLKSWWWCLYQLSARFHRLAGFLAALLYPLERLLLKASGSDGPTTKVIVCRKRARD